MESIDLRNKTGVNRTGKLVEQLSCDELNDQLNQEQRECINNTGLLKTGMTISQETGDDAYYSEGLGFDFWTLDSPNEFGNLSRRVNFNGDYFDPGTTVSNYVDGNLKDKDGNSIAAADLATAISLFGNLWIDIATNKVYSRTVPTYYSWEDSIIDVEADTEGGDRDWETIEFPSLSFKFPST